MNSKEKMLKVLSGGILYPPPVTPHWWGLYKFQMAGLIQGYAQENEAWKLSGAALFTIDEMFYNMFQPDMFHLTTGMRRYKDEKRSAAIAEARMRGNILDSKASVDSYMSLLQDPKEVVEQSGEFDHVALCSQKYGGHVLIALNEGSSVACFFDSYIGFEDGLVSLLEEPDNVQYFLNLLYTQTLDRLKVLKNKGAHAFINSETYCGADIMSPTLYHDIVYPVQQSFYKKVRDEIGLIPIVYFTGDIMPILEDIKQLGVSGLMVEASKKNFTIDIGKTAHRLENSMALFGNLNSHTCLELGSTDQIKAETARQAKQTRGCRFIMANDCPISFNTPVENIRAMMDAAREL